MRSPEILNPSNMTPTGIMHPSKLSVELSLKSVSTAKAEMPIDQMVDFGTWVKIYYPNGKSGIYRASAPEKDFDTGRATIAFDHGVKTLADNIINVGDTYDANNVAQPTYFEGTVTQVFTRMLGYQKTAFWQFGTTDTNENIKVEVDFDNLLSLMNETMQQLPNYYLDYDQSTYPWKVNIKRYPTTVKSEGRLSRNVRTAKVRYDDSDLVTRVYCEALTAGHLDSQNIGLYGIREASYYLNDVDNAFAVKACQNYLDLRDKPKCSITIEGADFSAITGVTLDQVLIGDLYRLAIPERNTTIEEQITGINYIDICNRPYELTITISRDRDDLSSVMAAVKTRAAKNTRASSKSASKVVHVYDKLVDEGIVVTEHGEVLRRAGIEFDENGVMIFAKELGLDGVEKLSGVFNVEAGRLTSDYTNKIAETESHITQTANEIYSVVSAANCATYTYIDQTACGIIARIHNQQRQIFTGQNTPGSGSGETVEEGALWIKYPKARTWEEAEDALTWVDNPTYNWNELGGSIIYEYINGQWVEKLNEATLAEDAYVEDTAHGLHRTYAAVTIDAQRQAHAYRSEWQQTASMLWNDMEDRANDLGSRIEQSTTQIRTEVHAAKSSLYSEIKQTATNIAQHVADEKKSIYSHIEQTASSISSSVVDLERGMYSNIRQTASEIRAHVKDVKEGLESTITQTASRIEARVANAEGDISTLTVTATSISTRVSDAEGNISSIVQTASEIRSDVSSLSGELASSILQTSTNIAIAVRDAKCDMQASINVQKNRIDLVVEDTSSGSNIRAAKIVESINAQTGQSQVLLSADQISISGSTTLSGSMTIDSGALWIKKNLSIGSTTGSLVTVNNGTLNAPNIQVNSGGALKIVGTGSGEVYNLNASTLATMIKSASVSGNTLTLTPFSGSAITFSKATSLSGAWSSGTHTVTAKQTNSGAQTTVATHTTTNQIVFDGNGSANFSVKLQTQEGSASSFTDRLSKYCYLVLSGSGRSQSVKAGANSDGSGSVGSLSVSSVYDDGWAAAYAKVLVPSAGTGSSVTVKWPGSTQGNQGQRVYTLQNNGNNEVILTYPDGSDTITAAKLTHNKYSSGYDAGYADGESAGSAIDYTEISAGNVTWDSQSISGRAQAGEISRPSARSYVKFSVTVRNVTRLFYIVIND